MASNIKPCPKCGLVHSNSKPLFLKGGLYLVSNINKRKEDMELRKLTFFVVHSNNDKKLLNAGEALKRLGDRKRINLLALNKGKNIIVGILDGATKDLRILLRKERFGYLDFLVDSRTIAVHPMADKLRLYFSKDEYVLSELAYDMQVDFDYCCLEGMTIKGKEEKVIPVLKQLMSSDSEASQMLLDVNGDVTVDGIYKLHEKPVSKLGYLFTETSLDFMVSEEHAAVLEKYSSRAISVVECQIN